MHRILSWVALATLIGCSSNKIPTEKAIVKIPTSICGECAHTIQTALMKVNGVTRADINTDTKLAVIEFIPTAVKIADIERSIVMAGYDANDKKRDAEAYEKLPDCCKK
jgi:mercuric ion binding protein